MNNNDSRITHKGTTPAIKPAGNALTWAVRELLGSLPERRDWLNPEVEAILRAALDEPGTVSVAKMVAEVAAELAVQLNAAPVAKVGYIPGHYEAGLDVEIIDRSRVHDGMMLYASPAARQWISVADELPEHAEDEAATVWATWTGAAGFAQGTPRQGEARYIKSMGWQPHGCMGWDWIVTHWMPLPPLPGESDDDQQFDRNAERLTREMGLGGGAINPNATTVLDLFTDDRRTVLLTAAHALLKKQAWTSEVLNLLHEEVHYDGTNCDGLCLISDIEDELGIDGDERPA